MVKDKGPVVLCVLSGWGHRDGGEDNAQQLAETPTLDRLLARHPRALLTASGEAVGLPFEQVGSGDVGLAVMGAGRVVPSARALIDEAVRNRKLSRVPMLDQTVRICMYDECPVHLIGLLSDAGVHSHIDHLFELIDMFNFNDVKVVVHAILDGRDTPRRSAMSYLNALEGYIEDKERVTIGTIGGRYWAMDRDERWDRVYRAFHAIVRDRELGPVAPHQETPYELMTTAYSKEIDDELVEPTRIGSYQGLNGDYLCDFATKSDHQIWEWTGLDAGLVFNFRGDRTRQLTGMLTRQGVPEYVTDDLLMDRRFPVRGFRDKCLTVFAHAGADIAVPVAFPVAPVEATLGEVLAARGLRQLRCAESEKTPHVTSFFSGGREAPFEGESRKIVRSPKLVETYDQKPEMAAAKIAEAVVAGIEGGEADFILVHFANLDAVAHSGDLAATKKAAEAVDAALERICAALEPRRGTLLLTSDHGNCERMTDARGEPNGAHTDASVPLVLARGSNDEAFPLRSEGTLADIAPTVLDVMGLDVPDVMTGRSLRG